MNKLKDAISYYEGDMPLGYFQSLYDDEYPDDVLLQTAKDMLSLTNIEEKEVREYPDINKAILHCRQRINCVGRSMLGAGELPVKVRVDIDHLNTLIGAAIFAVKSANSADKGDLDE